MGPSDRLRFRSKLELRRARVVWPTLKSSTIALTAPLFDYYTGLATVGVDTCWSTNYATCGSPGTVSVLRADGRRGGRNDRPSPSNQQSSWHAIRVPRLLCPFVPEHRDRVGPDGLSADGGFIDVPSLLPNNHIYTARG
jgi:hypothetical protein